MSTASSAVTYISEEVWENFFLACDLPDCVAAVYAQRFVKERMQPSILNALGEEKLKELGIDAIGDQLSVLRYIQKYGGAIPKEFGATPKEKQSARPSTDVNTHSDQSSSGTNQSSASRAPVKDKQSAEPSDEWVKMWSKGQNRYYYYNALRRQSQWADTLERNPTNVPNAHMPARQVTWHNSVRTPPKRTHTSVTNAQLPVPTSVRNPINAASVHTPVLKPVKRHTSVGNVRTQPPQKRG